MHLRLSNKKLLSCESSARRKRRGTVSVLMAFLLIPFLGMVAFAADVAWIVQSRSDLQNAADSAAPAGVEQLTGGLVQYSIPGQTLQTNILSNSESSAKPYAKNFASYNTADGVSSLSLLDSDIQFGFTNASNAFTPCPTYTGFPNTVKCTMRLDSTSNGALKLFFSQVFGMSSTNLQAFAAATLYTGSMTNFPGAVFDKTTVVPAGTTSSLVTTFTTPKLSQ
jgi:Flp pilus assembly protein TadG